MSAEECLCFWWRIWKFFIYIFPSRIMYQLYNLIYLSSISHRHRLIQFTLAFINFSLYELITINILRLNSVFFNFINGVS
jgi:hypothetical protein